MTEITCQKVIKNKIKNKIVCETNSSHICNSAHSNNTMWDHYTDLDDDDDDNNDSFESKCMAIWMKIIVIVMALGIWIRRMGKNVRSARGRVSWKNNALWHWH